MQSSRIGAPATSPRCARSGRGSVGSPQWMSSNTTTSGRCARDRLEEPADRPEPLLGSGAGTDEPDQRGDASADEFRARPPREREAILSLASLGRVEVARCPAACLTISTTGQNVIPSPYGRHRPRRTVARRRAVAGTPRRVATCRRPADPRTVNSGSAVADRPRSKARRSCAQLGARARPSASRADARCPRAPASPRPAGTRRPARTCPSARAARPARRPRRRGRAGRSPRRAGSRPARPACSSRAATLTASPVDERAARVAVAGDDLAGVHADPDLELHAVVALELLVQRVERAPHLDRGAHRAQRVVLVERSGSRTRPSPRRR